MEEPRRTDISQSTRARSARMQSRLREPLQSVARPPLAIQILADELQQLDQRLLPPLPKSGSSCSLGPSVARRMFFSTSRSFATLHMATCGLSRSIVFVSSGLISADSFR
uniref:Uncharacterized protein n=1 Tax=Anopheles atroparvus TaxID=41427 RepID=A0A182JDC1_ANOAO